MVSQTCKPNEVLDGRYGIAFYQSTYFKGPEVFDKATHPTMPKVQKINTSNTPSPISATKAMFYITQNCKRFCVCDRSESLATEILSPSWISKKPYVGFLKCLYLISVSPQSFRRKLKQYGYGTLAAGDIPENGGSSPYLFQSDFSTS